MHMLNSAHTHHRSKKRGGRVKVKIRLATTKQSLRTSKQAWNVKGTLSPWFRINLHAHSPTGTYSFITRQKVSRGLVHGRLARTVTGLGRKEDSKFRRYNDVARKRLP